jgi:hypothetical protein
MCPKSPSLTREGFREHPYCQGNFYPPANPSSAPLPVEASTPSKGPLASDPFGRKAPLLRSLEEGLLGNPLEVLTGLFPLGHFTEPDRVTSKRMVDILLHDNIKVGGLNFFLSFPSLQLFFICGLYFSSRPCTKWSSTMLLRKRGRGIPPNA